MRKMIQDYLFGGAISTYKIKDLVHGFESDVAERVNGGDFFMGDDFNLDKSVTAILNDQVGQM